MSNDWFRSWHGAPNDPKWIVIGRKAGIVPALAAWVGWALFDYASQSSQRGSIDGFDCESQAAWGGLEETQVVSCLETMTARGMIVAGRLANWEKRQPARERPEDNSTDRVRAMREKNKETKALQEQQADVTPCNATKRLDKIRLDTDTDTDTDNLFRIKALIKDKLKLTIHQLIFKYKSLFTRVDTNCNQTKPSRWRKHPICVHHRRW